MGIVPCSKKKKKKSPEDSCNPVLHRGTGIKIRYRAHFWNKEALLFYFVFIVIKLALLYLCIIEKVYSICIQFHYCLPHCFSHMWYYDIGFTRHVLTLVKLSLLSWLKKHKRPACRRTLGNLTCEDVYTHTEGRFCLFIFGNGFVGISDLSLTGTQAYITSSTQFLAQCPDVENNKVHSLETDAFISRRA